jgi:hypothetical protein
VGLIKSKKGGWGEGNLGLRKNVVATDEIIEPFGKTLKKKRLGKERDLREMSGGSGEKKR